MIFPTDKLEQYKVLPTTYRGEIVEKFKQKFAFKTPRRMRLILNQDVHVTPDEYQTLSNLIDTYYNFYTGQKAEIVEFPTAIQINK